MTVSLDPREALDALYRAWRDPLYDVALRLLKDHADAEDAVQRVFERLLMRPEHLLTRVPPERREAYLTSAVKKAAIDTLRDRRCVVDISRLAENTPTSALTPLQTTARAHALRLLDAMIAKLPPRCAEVMVAIRRDQLAQSEIAARMGITPKAVEKQVARGRKLLWRMPQAPLLAAWLDLWVGASSKQDGGG